MPLSSVCVMCVCGTSTTTSRSTPLLGIFNPTMICWIGSRRPLLAMLAPILARTLCRIWRITLGLSYGSKTRFASPTMIVVNTWIGLKRWATLVLLWISVPRRVGISSLIRSRDLPRRRFVRRIYGYKHDKYQHIGSYERIVGRNTKQEDNKQQKVSGLTEESECALPSKEHNSQ